MAANFRTAHVTSATSPLFAQLTLSGDKSVSIRRALFSLFTTDTIRLTNYGSGEDCQTALLCLRSLGKHVEHEGNRVTISHREMPKQATLDCRNSGTTARLLMGLLAGRVGEWTLVGDESLSRRPMERVATPLRAMGAEIELADGGCLPARIVGRTLTGTDHDLKISSAQVKSALLLAGLSANGVTRVREPIASRDHTERLLGLTQAPDGFWSVHQSIQTVAVVSLRGKIPGDISSAAFWAVAGLLVPGSDISIENVVLNPTRTGWLTCLKNAGANVNARFERETSGEPVGTLQIRYGKFSPLHVYASEVPGLIDEIPALAVLAAMIDGESRFEQVGELRVKESDRLQAITNGLTAMGAKVEILGDDLIVHGGAKLRGATIDPQKDHRIAMSFALAGLVASGKTVIQDADCAAVSYPEFFAQLSKLVTDSLTLTE
ncbi:MAG: 3-phosphoshikimate 1-carboxyvinyltransferase [bacterium]|nr:3-phosphoshikimate 1-carboxyvinyltransferase [bacterium]